MSKYASVDEAVKWMKGYYKAVSEHMSKEFKRDTEVWNGTMKTINQYGVLLREVQVGLDNSKTIAKMLEIKLEGGIDSKIKENGGTLQLLRNLREEDNRDIYSVNLRDMAIAVHKELGISTRPLNYINPESKVAPDFFEGLSYISEHPSARYNSSKPIERKDSRTNKKVVVKTK